MFRRLIQRPAVQAALARLVGLYLALVARTTRWSLLGAEHARPFAEPGRPVIVAFWHERLPLMPMALQAARRAFPRGHEVRAHVLVSRHRDGRMIGSALAGFDVQVVYASSSRGGASGLRALLRLLAAGHMVAITPDGPRGPRREAAAGVAQLAAISGVPVLPVAAATARGKMLRRSWDRMVLPLPFTRGVVAIGAPIAVQRHGAEAALPAIGAALTAACDAADAGVA